jgi:hypothetical protein
VTGLAGLALVTWTVRTLQAGRPAAAPPALDSPAALVLLLGTLAAIVAGGAATWKALSPIRNPWRQGVLAMIAGLGAFVVSLVTWPIDRAFGRNGLLALALAAAALAVLLRRTTRTPS